MNNNDLKYRIAKLQLAPGDVLVVKVDALLSQQQAQWIVSYARKTIGNDIPVLVLDRVTDIAVLTAKEIAKRATL